MRASRRPGSISTPIARLLQNERPHPDCERHPMNITKAAFGTALAAAVSCGGLAYAVDITGAGSTFAFPILAKWADAYKKETNNGVNYQSIGSGGGIKQIKANTVTFGASDKPLKVAD